MDELKHMPATITAILGVDGRHHAVPLMAPWSCDGKEPYHPRLGSITFGLGHAPKEIAEAIAKKIEVSYNAHSHLVSALSFIADTVYFGNPAAALNEIQLAAKSALSKLNGEEA